MPTPGTKLRVPLPRRTLVERPRLANPFVGSRGEFPRLVLVAAGAGFGKTTLLTQWLAGAPACRVAWVQLDESDADPQHFLSCLVTSLALIEPDVGREATALLAGDHSAPAEDVVASLLNDLDQLQQRTVVALDDYHRAGSPDLDETLRFLLENLPPQVTVALTTRADPPLPLARMRTRGELVEVRAEELRFTRDEAGEFLGTVMELDLAPGHVRALGERTEGWVAGLQLAALSARTRSESGARGAVDEFVDAFTGSHRFVLDYLVEEVLDGLDGRTRRFLLLTSVLDTLNGSLCEALTGEPGGQRTLEALDRANLFVVPLDEERQWYRYHHLFAEALRARLLAEHPDRVSPLHAAASRWYAARGLLDDAVRHATLDDDTQWLADLVELSLPGLRKERRNRAIVERLTAVPDEVLRTRAVLAPARAWVALSSGDVAGAAAWLDLADELTAHGASTTPSVREARPRQVPQELLTARADELRTVPANVAIYRAAIAQAAGDVDATVAHASRALELAEETDHLLRGAAAGFLGLAAWAQGDLRAAVRTFRDAVRHLGDAGNVPDQLGATVVLANMALALGDVTGARVLYENALAAAEANPEDGLRVTGDLHVGLAEVLREQNLLDSATVHLTSAAELGETSSFPENRFRLPMAQAGLLAAAGDLDGAVEQLERARSLYLPGFFPDTRPLPAQVARALIWGGRLDAARQWAEATGVAAADPSDHLREFDLLTRARLVAAEHRTRKSAGESAPTTPLSEVAAMLERLAQSAEAAGRRGSLVEIRLVAALVADASGDRPAALQHLADSVEEGVPAGYRRLFIDERAPLTSLLAELAATDGPSAAHARTLLAETDRATVPPPLPFGVEELSERELEVTRLLATDLTGPEIAAQLFVSINTLRTHTKHIFTKLGVKTRRAAVTRAAELHLI